MSNLLAPEGKISTVLGTIGDLIILNLLTILCSLPVFTFGAAFTSLYQITLKMVQKQDGHICSAYFSAFKENFRRSTGIWLLGGGLSLLMLFDIYILKLSSLSIAGLYRAVLFVLTAVVLLFTIFALVTSAYFENTVRNTIGNGIRFCMVHLPISFLILVITVGPFVLLSYSFRLLPLVIMLGLSGPAYLGSYYFADLFEKVSQKGTTQVDRR